MLKLYQYIVGDKLNGFPERKIHNRSDSIVQIFVKLRISEVGRTRLAEINN